MHLTLRKALEQFFARMNYLNELLHHLDVQLRLFRDDIRERISSGDVQASQFAAGSSLVIRDLTEWPSHGWAVYYPSGGFATQGDEFLALVDELTSREAAWALSQGFERFESCLKDLLAAYYQANPSATVPADFKRKTSGLAKAGLNPTSFDFWSAFVRRTYRSADAVLIILRQLAPTIDNAEHQNNYPVDLTRWFKLISEARHAVTHSNLVIARAWWDQLTPDEQQLLRDSLSGELSSEGYKLCPSVKEANAVLTRLTEYGYAAFKALSIAGGTEWRVLKYQVTQ